MPPACSPRCDAHGRVVWPVCVGSFHMFFVQEEKEAVGRQASMVSNAGELMTRGTGVRASIQMTVTPVKKEDFGKYVGLGLGRLGAAKVVWLDCGGSACVPGPLCSRGDEPLARAFAVVTLSD